MKKLSVIPVLFFLPLVAGCAGSSGGGGGSGSGPPVLLIQTPPVPPVRSPGLPRTSPVAELEGYYRQYLTTSVARLELGDVGTPRAYANIYRDRGANAAGRPGGGVTIGFIDSGLDVGHPSFEGKSVKVEYFDSATEAGDYDTGFSHGTSVASIAAGVRRQWATANGVVFSSEGVAPGAGIWMFAIPTGRPAPVIRAPTGEQLIAGNFSDNEEFESALDPARGVDVLNISLDFTRGGKIDDYSEDTLRAAFGDRIKVFEQKGRSEKTVIVWSAGNNFRGNCETGTPGCVDGVFEATSPSVSAGLPALIEELRGHFVAVVATGTDGAIAGFSNRCGIAANWCIAAPGQNIGVADSTRSSRGAAIRRSVSLLSGTSFSAPIVSGGLALMKQYFRGQLSNTDLLSRMFATADKTGRYADSSIYGQGLLDLGAATEPVGAMEIYAGDSVGERGAGLSDTRLSPGRAFGDGFSRSFAGREIAAFDSLGAPFWFPLEKFAAKRDKSVLRLQARRFLDFPPVGGGSALAGGGKPESAEISVRPPAVSKGGGLPDLGKNRSAAGAGLTEGEFSLWKTVLPAAEFSSVLPDKIGHLSFVDESVSFASYGTGRFSVSAFAPDVRRERTQSGAMVFYSPKGLPLSFRSGLVLEPGTLLGGFSGGAFGDLSAATAFAGMGFVRRAGAWRISADAEIGSVSPEHGAGLIREMSHLMTSAFGLTMLRNFRGGSAIRLSVLSPLRIENGRMKMSIPVGRTKNGEVVRDSVAADLAPSGRQIDFGAQWIVPVYAGAASIGTVVSRHPGHDKSAEPQVSLLAGYAMNF